MSDAVLTAEIERRERLIAEMERTCDAVPESRDLNDGEVADLEVLRRQVKQTDAVIAAVNTRSSRRLPPERGSKPAAPRKWLGDGKAPAGIAAAARTPTVKVHSEPGPYGDGPAGLRRFLVDLAVDQMPGYVSLSQEHSRTRATDRLDRHRTATRRAESADPHSRAVAMSNLGGVTAHLMARLPTVE